MKNLEMKLFFCGITVGLLAPVFGIYLTCKSMSAFHNKDYIQERNYKEAARVLPNTLGLISAVAIGSAILYSRKKNK